MSYLDIDGLNKFYAGLKNIFIRKVNNSFPDENGNINISIEGLTSSEVADIIEGVSAGDIEPSVKLSEVSEQLKTQIKEDLTPLIDTKLDKAGGTITGDLKLDGRILSALKGSFESSRFKVVPYLDYSILGATPNTSDYYKKVICWLVANYPNDVNYNYIISSRVGTRGTMIVRMYDNRVKNAEGLTDFCFGIDITSKVVSFGVQNYNFFCENLAKESSLNTLSQKVDSLHDFNYTGDRVLSSTKATITIPKGLMLNVGNSNYTTQSSISLSTSTLGSASTLAGKDFYVYACVNSSNALTFTLSANSTVPSGYTADNSRKIGGFHCLCFNVGAITNHPLSNYVAGDILPASVWDLKHRPKCNPEGFAYDAVTDMWFSIYLMSWDGSKLVSVYNGVIADGASTKKWHGEAFVEQLALQKMRLPWRYEYQMVAKGSNECTSIKGSADPNTTGSHQDTASRRMISNIGLEDYCGVMWIWLNDLGFAGGSAWTDCLYNSSVDSQRYGQSYGTLYRLRGGGDWSNGGCCGSRCTSCNTSSGVVYSNSGCCASSEPLGRKP